MNKNYNELFDETYYTETLDNGLKVVIFHKPDFVSSTCTFGTTYGGLNIHQKQDSTEYNFNPGIAHFLEHKLFESEEKDIFNQFSLMGCNVNAFTSYNETVYFFSTTNENIDEPLNLLLDFVQSLDITDKSVEKEKGIIIQELSTYLQNPDSRLLNEGYSALYHEYPLKYDIGGNAKTVTNITKDELYKCYNLNYHPSNMAVVIASPIDPEHLMEIIRSNQDKRKFNAISKVVDNNKVEIDQVVKKENTIKMDINKAKHLYAIKLKPDFKDENDCIYKEWCMNIYLKAYFSSINPNYQEWINNGIINDYFGYEVDFNVDYANILFYNESNNDNLKNLVDEALKQDLITEEILEQIKRRYVGESFEAFNDTESFATGFIRDYLNGYNLFNSIQILMNINLNDLKTVFKGFNYDNYSLIHILPSGK